MSLNAHHSTTAITHEWLTPPEIIEALGPFDLDPCASKVRPWPTAKTHFTVDDDGLAKEWFGRVWLNPPYGKHAVQWLLKMMHYGNGIALTFARTETRWFFHTVWNASDGILFLEGRLHFYQTDGIQSKMNAGAGSVLVAYGKENVEILSNSGIAGKFIEL